VTLLKSVLNGALPRRTSLPSKDTLLSWSPTTWITASKATKGKIFSVEIFELVYIDNFLLQCWACGVCIQIPAAWSESTLPFVSKQSVRVPHWTGAFAPWPDPQCLHQASLVYWAISHGRQIQQGKLFVETLWICKCNSLFLDCEITLFDVHRFSLPETTSHIQTTLFSWRFCCLRWETRLLSAWRRPMSASPCLRLPRCCTFPQLMMQRPSVGR
jgi:hypothetical protein